MTVLAKYQRLETEGLWKPDPDAQRRDVIVSIGKATLTLCAPTGPALTHWSLPAIKRLNPGASPALYAPGEDAPETLEITDETMVDAIEQVLKAVNAGNHHPGRLRNAILTGSLLTFAVLLVFWVPGAISRYTASIVPDAARATIGQSLMQEVRRVAGAPCASSSGLRALASLQDRLFPEGGRRLAVLPSTLPETQSLPGGTILIGHTLVEDYETPEVLAGYILAEDLRRQSDDPLKAVLADAGLGATLTLLTKGKLPDGALAPSAERIIASRSDPVPDTHLIARMAKAGIATAPYAYARDISGETTFPLIEASQTAKTTTPILADGEWLALQQICEN